MRQVVNCKRIDEKFLNSHSQKWSQTSLTSLGRLRELQPVETRVRKV